MIANIYYSSYVQCPIKGFTVVTYWTLTKFIRIGYFISLYLHFVDEETKVQTSATINKVIKVGGRDGNWTQAAWLYGKTQQYHTKPIKDFKF